MAERQYFLLDPHPRTAEMIYTADVAAELAGLGEVVAHFGGRAPDSLVDEHLAQVTVLIGQTAMPAARLARAARLRAIINVKANWEPNIDYAAAARRGVYVLSTAPAMAPPVAEYCVGQAIALGRGLYRADRLFRRGAERYGIAGSEDAYSLYDAAVGLIGYGNVGRCLRRLLAPFGCACRVFDPWLSAGYLREQGVQPAALDELLAASDFVFVLAGATVDNEGFLDAARLGMIKPGAALVLASRAAVVDFDALVALAGQGRLRAAIDVFPREPVAADDPCRRAPAAYSAHLAGALHASYRRMRALMMDDIRQLASGLPPLRLQRAEPQLAAQMRSR